MVHCAAMCTAFHTIMSSKQRLTGLGGRLVELQIPEVLEQGVISQLLHTPWKSTAILTCKLLQPQDEACQQVAKLTHSQLTIAWQVIVASPSGDPLASCARLVVGSHGAPLAQKLLMHFVNTAHGLTAILCITTRKQIPFWCQTFCFFLEL